MSSRSNQRLEQVHVWSKTEFRERCVCERRGGGKRSFKWGYIYFLEITTVQYITKSYHQSQLQNCSFKMFLVADSLNNKGNNYIGLFKTILLNPIERSVPSFLQWPALLSLLMLWFLQEHQTELAHMTLQEAWRWRVLTHSIRPSVPS